MSETAEAPPERKMQRLRPNTQAALLCFLDAERFIKKPYLPEIARRFGITYGTLRQTICRFRKGLIDLGPEPSEEEKQVSLKAELLRSADLLTRADKFLNDTLESQIVRAEQASARGEFEYFADVLKMDRTFTMMTQVARLRGEKEKGFLSMLEHAQKEQHAAQAEKPADAKLLSDAAPQLEKHQHDRGILAAIDAELVPVSAK